MDVKKPQLVLHFRQRADDFYRAAKDLGDLEESVYAPAIGLLSIHGCIALADALLVATDGERPKGEDHAAAARKLRDTCSKASKEVGGIKHFEWLLTKKSHFSYGEQRVDGQDLRKAKGKMEQFFKWVWEKFPEIAQIEDNAIEESGNA